MCICVLILAYVWKLGYLYVSMLVRWHGSMCVLCMCVGCVCAYLHASIYVCVHVVAAHEHASICLYFHTHVLPAHKTSIHRHTYTEPRSQISPNTHPCIYLHTHHMRTIYTARQTLHDKHCATNTVRQTLHACDDATCPTIGL